MNDPGMNDLVAAILEGDAAKSVSLARQLRKGGTNPEDIVVHGVEVAMSALDAKCTLEQFNLLEIMLAGRAVTEVLKSLYPAGSSMATTKATVVIAALEGDVHDLARTSSKPSSSPAAITWWTAAKIVRYQNSW